MFPFKRENMDNLISHNIRIRQLNPSNMSQQPPKKMIHLPQIRMVSRGRASSIKITNVKSIKPPDPKIVKKNEEEKLRAKLQKEIEHRSRACANISYECPLPVLKERDYCAKHILQDPTAPYKQCSHAYSNGERCTMPAPAQSTAQEKRDHGLCFEHARASMLARQRNAAPPPPVISTESLLNQLQHYVQLERVRTTSCASTVSVVSEPTDQESAAPRPVDPFKEINAPAVNASISTSILECYSDTDSESETALLGRGGDVRGDERDHPPAARPALTLGGIYTAEEAVVEARRTLEDLQKGYYSQLRRLKLLLRMARTQYLAEMRAEKESCCSINSQARTGALTVKERKQLRKLKAYAGFHRKHGMDAVMARKLQRKRAKSMLPPNRVIPSQGRCSFSEGGVRCSRHTLPAAHHCPAHILHDRAQVLFVACGGGPPSFSCQEPVVVRGSNAANNCRYHHMPPSYAVFTTQKENSDSEDNSEATESARSDIVFSEDVDEPSAGEPVEDLMPLS